MKWYSRHMISDMSSENAEHPPPSSSVGVAAFSRWLADVSERFGEPQSAEIDTKDRYVVVVLGTRQVMYAWMTAIGAGPAGAATDALGPWYVAHTNDDKRWIVSLRAYDARQES